MRIFSFIATGFGSGYLPKMPGTWGSVVGLFLSFFCLLFFSSSLSALTFILVGVFFIGFLSTFIVLHKTHEKDPSYVVIDEIIGIMIPIFLLHTIYSNITVVWGYLFPFLVFRFFDIIKPFPINVTESYFLNSSNKLMHSLGIMLDDVVAGSMTAGVLIISYQVYVWFS